MAEITSSDIGYDLEDINELIQSSEYIVPETHYASAIDQVPCTFGPCTGSDIACRVYPQAELSQIGSSSSASAGICTLNLVTSSTDDYVSPTVKSAENSPVVSSTPIVSSTPVVSSTSSVEVIELSGGANNQSNGRRRQRLENKKDLVCKVCGDKATGFNFGAVTCESCKAFFRRTANKKKPLYCQFENNCHIDCHTRKFCTSCRLAKCFTIGMKKEWILDDDQKMKRKPIKKKEKVKPQTVTSSTVKLSERDERELKTILENHDDIDQIDTSNQSRKNCPDAPVDYSKLAGSPLSVTEVISMTHGYVRRLIKFFKTCPEVHELSTHDQMVLIKEAIWETFMLRSATVIEVCEDEMSALEDKMKRLEFSVKHLESNKTKKIKLEFIKFTFGEEIYQLHYKIALSFNEIVQSDKTCLILVTVINLLTPEREGLENKDKVEAIQGKYRCLLQSYLRSKYDQKQTVSMLSRLVVKLCEVRTYAKLSTDSVKDLGFDEKSLLTLLQEVFEQDELI